MSERDLARLPKWARDRISLLERELASARKENRLMVEGETNVWIDSIEPVPLPPDSRIRFDLPGGQEIQIRAETMDHEAGGIGRLVVYCARKDYRLLFAPGSTNTGYLYNLDPRYLIPDPGAPK